MRQTYRVTYINWKLADGMTCYWQSMQDSAQAAADKLRSIYAGGQVEVRRVELVTDCDGDWT